MSYGYTPNYNLLKSQAGTVNWHDLSGEGMWHNIDEIDRMLLSGEMGYHSGADIYIKLYGPNGDQKIEFYDTGGDPIIKWDYSNNRFDLNKDLKIARSLFFGTSNNQLLYDDDNSRFILTDDLYISGQLTAEGGIVGGGNGTFWHPDLSGTFGPGSKGLGEHPQYAESGNYTADQLEELTGGGVTALHSHAGGGGNGTFWHPSLSGTFGAGSKGLGEHPQFASSGEYLGLSGQVQDMFAAGNYLDSTYENITAEHASCKRNSNYLTIPSPYSPSCPIHPRVLYFPNKWPNSSGYRFWMAFTPYDLVTHENPCIVASQDGQTWVVPAGLTNPLDTPGSGHNSDTELILGYDGKLYCMYRWTDDAVDKLYIRSSSNGVTWSSATEVLSDGAAELLSPSLEKSGGTYYMWVVDSAPNPNVMKRYSSSDMVNWTYDQICTGSVSGLDLWHMRFIRHGNCYYGLMTVCALGLGGTNPKLYFCTSLDGINWTYSSAPILNTGNDADWDKYPYVASPLWMLRGHEYRLAMWYSAAANVYASWHTGYTEINLDSILRRNIAGDRLGINTTYPQEALHVTGGEYVSGNVRVGGNIQVSGDAIILGPGTAGNVEFYANEGSANKPGIRFNDSTSKWEYSNDGLVWNEMGSGSGGGGTTVYQRNRSINLPIAGAILPTLNPAEIQKVFSSRLGPPKPAWVQANFDATTAEYIMWAFRMPEDYNTGLKARIQFKMASATTGGVTFGMYVSAVTSGDASNLNDDGYANPNYGRAPVPGVSGQMSEAWIDLTNDESLMSGDFINIALLRDCDDAYDTATGDAQVIAAQLRYLSPLG